MIVAMRNSLVFGILVLGACGGDEKSINSDEQARRAYLGLDASVSKSLKLGFDGYNAASSANIPAQMTTGDKAGTLAITGKVDQGNPSQATMTLSIGMVGYDDGPFVIDDKMNKIEVKYDTNTDPLMQPVINLKLNSSAGNSLTGTLLGDYTMSGDLKGKVTLDLTLTGTFSGTAPNVMRVAGSTTVTGTAVNSDGGMYQVNATL